MQSFKKEEKKEKEKERELNKINDKKRMAENRMYKQR